MKKLLAWMLAAVALAAPVAHADPDDDSDDTTQQICTAFDLGVPPADIPGRLGANDGRQNYWRAQRETEQATVGGGCER
jgi:hypothetical protein